MKTRKTWEKLLGIFLAVVLILGMIPVAQLLMRDKDVQSNAGAATPSVVYVKTSNCSWWHDNGSDTWAYFWTDGVGSEWVKMTKVEDKVYMANNSKGYARVLFARVNPSQTGTPDFNNKQSVYNKTGDQTIPTDGRNLFTLSNDAKGGSWSTYTPSDTPPIPVTGDFYVMGDEALTGEDWEPKADGMTLKNGLYELTYSDVPVGTYSFRITDGTLDNTWPTDADKTFKVRTAGKVTITFNATTREITVTTPDPVAALSKYYVAGEMNNWATNDIRFNMTKNANGTYEYIGFVDPGELWFKVTDGNGTWYPSGSGNDVGETTTKTVKVLITFDGSSTPTYKILDSDVETDSHGVDTDLFDYLNDDVVNYPDSTNWETGAMQSTTWSPYSYINQVISAKGYTIPLYFGNLLHTDNRGTLNNWYTAPNVAPEDANGNANYNAAVQGLVGSTLTNGNLTDPYDSTKELLYFSTTIPNASNGNPVMRHYGDLEFPFQKYTDANGISTYVYDTVTSGYSVYYNGTNLYADYDNSSKNAVVAWNGVIDGDAGFYPFSTPGCRWGANNYAFSSKFTIQFTVSDDGRYKIVNGDTTTYQDVVFSFTGDDDVWVFIDDQLVLDMGGCHTKATGIINFADLTATVVNAFDINEDGLDSFKTITNNSGDRAHLDTGVITKYFPEELANTFDEEYLNNKAEVHTLTMFYMERGLFDSNMSISFSITPLPSGLTVSKDIEGVDADNKPVDLNPGLNAAIQAEDTFNFVFDNYFYSYALTGVNGVATRYTATNNTISGVRGDIYASNFWANNEGAPAFGTGASFVVTEQDVVNPVFTYVSTDWALYDADNGYEKIKYGDGKKAEFKFHDTNPSNYALNFINRINVGSLTVEKVDPLNEYTGRNFTFRIELDLDGNGTNFDEKYYEGLVYKIGDVEYKTRADGKFTLKPGEKATFTGIPVGASYEVTEVYDPNSSSWEPTYTDATGEIKETISEVIVSNSKKTEKAPNYVIYVESQEVIKAEDWQEVSYIINMDETPLTLTSVQSNKNIIVGLGSKAGEVIVTSAKKSGTYNLTYKGTRQVTDAEGQVDTHVYTGTLTIHVVKATNKTYVFDFGLSSNLADTTTGSGLFQGGAWGTADTTATLKTLKKDDESKTQTSIAATLNNTINLSTNAYNGGKITFTPESIMSQKETYTYTVWVGETDVEDAPDYGKLDCENGAWVTGYITVMPANTVYYEDGFALDNKFDLPSLEQSNDQEKNYGWDIAYNKFEKYSNGSATHLKYDQTKNIGETATFTFTGTGFDIISMTTDTSGGMKVELFPGETSVDANAKALVKNTYYVDNVFTNGYLYQVPVMSVMDLAYDTYTVRITSLDTYGSTDGVYIDGIRIYNPLGEGAVTDYRDAEEKVYFVELRDLYFSGSSLSKESFENGKLSLVQLTKNGDDIKWADGAAIVEHYGKDNVQQVATLAKVFQSGPNNEMYLPKGYGIQFKYDVITADKILQIGAKAIAGTNEEGTSVGTGSIDIYVDGEKVGSVSLNSATDMYHDLTSMLKNLSGTVTIINNSNAEFVSLTTVKCSVALS